MEFSAQQIAALIGGQIEGNPSVKVTKLSKIEEGVSGSISFLSNPAYKQYIFETDASVVIVAIDIILEKPVKQSCTLIRVNNPRESFAKLLEAYNQIKLNKSGIEHPSYVSNSAKVGDNVYIGAFAYIADNAQIGNNVKIYPNAFVGENTIIGDNTIIYPGGKIYSDCIVGKNCILHAGIVVGSDGFGFEPGSDKEYKKVPHIGNVIIEDDVEIGANACIDRATLGSTIIRKGAKLDNLIQIAHNVEIGERTVIAGLSAIAGSSKIGKGCMLGGQSGVIGHLTVADGVKIAGQSGVGNNITKPGEIVQGSPSFYIGEYKRSYVLFRKLPELQQRIRQLEKSIEELKQSVPR